MYFLFIFKMKLEFPACNECNDGEFRVKVDFEDPERKNIPIAMYLRSLSPTQIKIYLRLDGHPLGVGDGDPDYIRVPIKECIMNKI